MEITPRQTPRLTIAIGMACGLLLHSSTTFAASAEEKGLAIMTELDKRDHGFINTKSSMEMILRNSAGDSSKRQLRTMTLEVDNDGDKSIIIFDKPGDVAGTASLTFSHSSGPDEQWLYLPAIKRVKRISSKNKSGPFMGSEFAFEDISSQELDKYTYKFLREEQLDGNSAYVIEAYPEYNNSGYNKLVLWIDSNNYYRLKTHYFDRKGSSLKSLSYTGYKQYLDKFWRASTMEMINHQTKKSTTLNWGNYEFQVDINDSTFRSSNLKRIR